MYAIVLATVLSQVPDNGIAFRGRAGGRAFSGGRSFGGGARFGSSFSFSARFSAPSFRFQSFRSFSPFAFRSYSFPFAFSSYSYPFAFADYSLPFAFSSYSAPFAFSSGYSFPLPASYAMPSYACGGGYGGSYGASYGSYGSGFGGGSHGAPMSAGGGGDGVLLELLRQMGNAIQSNQQFSQQLALTIGRVPM